MSGPSRKGPIFPNVQVSTVRVCTGSISSISRNDYTGMPFLSVEPCLTGLRFRSSHRQKPTNGSSMLSHLMAHSSHRFARRRCGKHLLWRSLASTVLDARLKIRNFDPHKTIALRCVSENRILIGVEGVFGIRYTLEQSVYNIVALSSVDEGK